MVARTERDSQDLPNQRRLADAASVDVCTGIVPLTLTLPPDLRRRLATLRDAIAAASADVLFAYLFGSASTHTTRPPSDVDIAIFIGPGAARHAVPPHDHPSDLGDLLLVDSAARTGVQLGGRSNVIRNPSSVASALTALFQRYGSHRRRSVPVAPRRIARPRPPVLHRRGAHPVDPLRARRAWSGAWPDRSFCPA